MKKLVLFGFIFAGLSFTSCKKYTCECNGVQSGDTHRKGVIGFNAKKLSCESSTDCDWVVAN